MAIIRILKKYNRILSNQQKIRIIRLIFLMVLGGLFETMSVSLMIPLMNGILDTGKMMSKWYVQIFCRLFNVNTSRGFLICISIIIAFLFILKNLYLIFEYNIQYNFVYKNMFKMQSRLLNIFIHRPYEYFMNVSSAEVIRVIDSDIRSVFQLLSVLLQLFTELIIALMLIIGIFIISPIITICVAILLLAVVLLIYLTIKPTLKKQGEIRNHVLGEMYKWLLQSIQGIKEVKVMKKEDYFQSNFDKNGKIYVRSLSLYSVYSVVPRFIIEGVCLSSMFLAVAIMVFADVDLESLIPVLTAVAMAAIRLLPSVNRISAALTQLAYGEPSIDKVIENMQEIEDFDQAIKSDVSGLDKPIDEVKSEGSRRIDLKNSINVENLSYHYPSSDAKVLCGVNLSIRKGDTIGIVGASGAGKTTLVDLILGILTPQRGKVLVDGRNINDNLEEWLDRVGYIPQTIFMLDGTIRENIAFGEDRDAIFDDEVWRALDEAALKDFIESLPEGLDAQIGERGVRLSGGQRQRIGIARALYRNPEALIFDEATSALDNSTEAEIMEAINNLHGKKTMIIIAHRLTTIEACDYVYRVEEGRIAREE